jgi:hypothetical protein
MMKAKRDLLVLSKKASEDPSQLKQEIELLDAILFLIETTKNLCTCVEVVDINSFKIIQGHKKLEKVLNQRELKPFQFLFNKN